MLIWNSNFSSKTACLLLLQVSCLVAVADVVLNQKNLVLYLGEGTDILALMLTLQKKFGVPLSKSSPCSPASC